MKKILLLILSLLILTACGNDDSKKGPMVIQEVNKQSTVKEQLKLGDTWEIPGFLKLTVDSVKTTSEKSPFYEKPTEQVVIVRYTYENLGLDFNEDGIIIMEPNSVVDGAGKTAHRHPLIMEHTPESIQIGESSTVDVPYRLSEKSDEIKVSFHILTKKVSSDEDIYAVDFICPVDKNE